MNNFTIVHSKDILFCGKKHIANLYCECNECKGAFNMKYIATANGDGSWNKKYEYKYCPHCAKELKEYE